MPSSIGNTAVTARSASVVLSSIFAGVAPNLGGCNTTAVSIDGRVTSMVYRVVPRIFPAVSTRIRPSRPIRLYRRGAVRGTADGNGRFLAGGPHFPDTAALPHREHHTPAVTL